MVPTLCCQQEAILQSADSDGVDSQLYLLIFWVSQRSFLCPLLFLVHIDKLSRVLSKRSVAMCASDKIFSLQTE